MKMLLFGLCCKNACISGIKRILKADVARNQKSASCSRCTFTTEQSHHIKVVSDKLMFVTSKISNFTKHKNKVIIHSSPKKHSFICIIPKYF